MSFVRFFSVLAILLVFGGGASADTEVGIIKKYINNGNHIGFHNELNEIRKNIEVGIVNPEEVANFLVSLWEKDKTTLTDIDWNNINRATFRVSLAGNMMLMVRDGGLVYDTSDLQEYLRGEIKNQNEPTAYLAIHHLALARNKNDIEGFHVLARSESLMIFRAAITALGIVCRTEAKNALQDIESVLLNQDRITHVKNTLERYYGNKQLSCRLR